MLLPPDAVTDEEQGIDPRAELIARLLEYERFKQAAGDLDARPLLGRDVFAAVAVPPEETRPGEAELTVSLFQLVEAFRSVLAAARKQGVVVHEVEIETITVRERMIVLMDRLEEVESLDFLELLRGETGAAPTRQLIVTTFLAMLELTRLSAIRIYQGVGADGAPDGPIRLRRAGDSANAPWSDRISEWM
jgi:segregation and condensation protein A